MMASHADCEAITNDSYSMDAKRCSISDCAERRQPSSNFDYSNAFATYIRYVHMLQPSQHLLDSQSKKSTLNYLYLQYSAYQKTLTLHPTIKQHY